MRNRVLAAAAAHDEDLQVALRVQRAPGDVAAVVHAFEAELLHGVVAHRQRAAQRHARAGHGQHAAAGRLEHAALLLRARVVHVRVRHRRRRVHAGDGQVLRVRLRVARRRRHDGRGEAVLPLDAVLGQRAAHARHAHVVEVALQQRQQHLRLRVAEAAVVLQHHRAAGGQHQAHVQHAHVGRALRGHGLHGAVHEVLGLALQRLGQARRRRVRAHAARVQALVAFVHALVVLRAGHDHGARAVAEGEHRHLLSLEALLDHHLGAGRAKLRVQHHLLQRLHALLGALRQHHALAGREAGRLDDHLVVGGLEVGLGLREVGEGRVARGGDAVALHEVLGEGLGALQPRGRGRGAEARDAGRAAGVREAVHERLLRPDHDEADLLLLGEADDGLLVGVVERGVLNLRAAALRPAVARRDVHLRDALRVGEGGDDRVLAAAGADDEDADLLGADAGERVGDGAAEVGHRAEGLGGEVPPLAQRDREGAVGENALGDPLHVVLVHDDRHLLVVHRGGTH